MLADFVGFRGPYYTSWTSGQVVSIAQYTGLTGYTSFNDAFTSAFVETIYPSGVLSPAAGSAAATSMVSAARHTRDVADRSS
jgi:hypothetical protein